MSISRPVEDRWEGSFQHREQLAVSLFSCRSSTEFPLLRKMKIVAIGRNFKDHAKELGNAVPKSPFYFLKPQSSIILPGSGILLPKLSSNVHHEIELAAVIGRCASNISPATALSHVKGYTLALDLTARDLQTAAKKVCLTFLLR